MVSKTRSQNSAATKILWAFFLVVLVAIVFKGIFTKGKTLTPQTEGEKLHVFGEIPNFTLIRQNGKPLNLSELRGKVWIADFIFTHCAGPCPLITSQMRQIAEQFKEEPNLRFVSFSVDPERDTPTVLSQYAGRYGADPEKWLFLTGDKAEIYNLTQRHFRLGITEIPPGEREATDQTIIHSTKFVLVDEDARIRGYYDSQDKTQIDQLIRDTKQLMQG